MRVGSYRLIERIGAGGMGEVWLAEHATLGRRAAIKLLHASLSQRVDIVKRFFNEARAATAIADPGIVQVFDFGYAADGAAFIVMELLDGETLDARMRRTNGLAVSDALRIMRQVASSLGAAHARGIVHRDLKPENIFLVRDPEVPGGERAKLLDFGIAKVSGDHGVKTQTSAVMGTPAFMSPEQCRGAALVDQRSDVYSLGCVLFMLLAGRPPFVGEGVGDLIVLHVREPAPRVRSLVPDLAPTIDDLIARCLAKDPAERFASGAELARALDILRVDALLPTIVQPAASSATPTTLSGASAERLAAVPVGTSSRARVVAGSLAVIATCVSAILVLGGRRDAALVATGASPADAAVVAEADAANAVAVDAVSLVPDAAGDATATAPPAAFDGTDDAPRREMSAPDGGVEKDARPITSTTKLPKKKAVAAPARATDGPTTPVPAQAPAPPPAQVPAKAVIPDNRY